MSVLQISPTIIYKEGFLYPIENVDQAKNYIIEQFQKNKELLSTNSNAIKVFESALTSRMSLSIAASNIYVIQLYQELKKHTPKVYNVKVGPLSHADTSKNRLVIPSIGLPVFLSITSTPPAP